MKPCTADAVATAARLLSMPAVPEMWTANERDRVRRLLHFAGYAAGDYFAELARLDEVAP